MLGLKVVLMLICLFSSSSVLRYMKHVSVDDNQADSFFFHYCSGEINMQITYLLLKSNSASSLNLKLYRIYKRAVINLLSSF